MKKEILLTFALFTFFIGQHCAAQIKTGDSSVIRFRDIKSYILNDYKVDQAFLDTACVNTIVLLKFKIVNSRIDSVEFTKSTPFPIRRALERALRLDRTGLTLIDAKPLQNRTVIIPILFAYLSRCKFAPIDVDSNGAIINPKSTDHYTSLVLAFRDILDFDSGNKASMDCIWLSSMSFSSLH